MKLHIPILALAVWLVASPAWGAEEVRTWTDLQGRTIQGKFVNATAQEIVVLLANGTQAHLSRAVLSAGDLAYADQALANRPVAATVEAGKSMASSKTHEIMDGTGSIRMATEVDEKWSYSIKVTNQGSVAGQNLHFDYCIYLQKAADHGQMYDSSKLRVANPRTLGSLPPLTPINGSGTIAVLPPREAVTLSTDPVEVTKTELHSPYAWAITERNSTERDSRPVSDVVEGIWVRVYQGPTIIAEYVSSEAYRKAGFGVPPPVPPERR